MPLDIIHVTLRLVLGLVTPATALLMFYAGALSFYRYYACLRRTRSAHWFESFIFHHWFSATRFFVIIFLPIHIPVGHISFCRRLLACLRSLLFTSSLVKIFFDARHFPGHHIAPSWSRHAVEREAIRRHAISHCMVSSILHWFCVI